MKRAFTRRVLTPVLALAMLASPVLTAHAADVTYTIQTAPMEVDDNLILCAAHAQADVTPEILGLTNTTDRANEVPSEYSLEKASTSALMGNFGTDINEYPNPYLYNWVYNSYAAENGLPLVDKHTLGGISGNPNSVDTEVSEEWGGTSRSLYYRPDILVGTSGGDYNELIADLPENKDADTSNDYDPYIVNYAMSRSYDFIDTLYDLANLCQEIHDSTGKVTRYGDTLTIADNLTKYTKGFQLYVLSQLAKEGKEQKTVAIVDPINSADGVFLAVDEETSVQGTTTHSRAGEFMADTTVNIVEVLGKETTEGEVGGRDKTYYVLTAEEVLQADVIVISGVQNQDGDEAAFRELLVQYTDPSNTALLDKAETVPIMATRFQCAGSIGANSIENLLGMAYWTAFAYPEYANPVYVATYWYKNFYHITENSSLQTIIAANFADASIPSGYGYTTDISGYQDGAIESMIIEGLDYYDANKASLGDLLLTQYGNNGGETWEINRSSGIGSGAQPAPEEASAVLEVYACIGTDGNNELLRSYTADELAALAEENPTGNAYGYYRRGQEGENAVVVTEYVTLSTLLADAGVQFRAGSSLAFTCADGPYTKADFSYENLDQRGLDPAGNPVPNAFALTWGAGPISDGLEAIAASAENTGNIRFVCGATQEELDTQSAGGNRLPSDVCAVTVLSPIHAQASAQKLVIDGVEQTPIEIYNINGNNFFKLRDLAALLSGGAAQFSVSFDQASGRIDVATGQPYESVGGELEAGTDKSASCQVSAQSLYVDGTEQAVTVFNLGGNNFLKLRQLGALLGFQVDYDSANDAMVIITG